MSQPVLLPESANFVVTFSCKVCFILAKLGEQSARNVLVKAGN